MSQESLRSKLDSELRALSRLRERIVELRYVLNWESEGIRVFYAVDFSEIFSYLHREDEDESRAIGVSLDQENTETNQLHYRLALSHLFNGFAKPLFVLPSHVLEMWSYVKTANLKSNRKTVQHGKSDRLFKEIRSLPPEVRSLLNSLGDKKQPAEASQKLLEFVKSGKFGPLCADVSEFVTWHKRGSLLKRLIQDGILSPRLNEMLAKRRISDSVLQEPSQKEVSAIVKTFGELDLYRPPFATTVDARAFLVLRNLNKVLAEDNARIVLVTRDTQLLRVAKKMADDRKFDWDDARRCVRGIESIFLDLTLANIPSSEDKKKWVHASEHELGRMHEYVRMTLNRIAESPRKSFAKMGEDALKETTQLWDQHTNVKLSLASKKVAWMGQAFLDISKEGLPETFKDFRSEYQILQNLLEYLSTSTYREMAVEDVKAIWSEIETDCIRMGFLNFLNKGGDKLARSFLPQTLATPGGPSKTIIHSQRFLRMPSLQLVSQTYKDNLQSLRITNDPDELERKWVSLVTEVMTGHDEPEDLLIMAFLLGILEEWEDSLEAIKKCRSVVNSLSAESLPQRIIPSEIDYMSSAIYLRMALEADDVKKATELYLRAYRDIIRARAVASEDPRYIVSEAASAMLYRASIKKLDSATQKSIDHPKLDREILSESAVRQHLIIALDLATKMKDRRLIMVILNNLAFMEVDSEQPRLQEAGDYLKRVQEIVKTASPEEVSLFSGLLPHIHETRIMLRARRARDKGDLNLLEECGKKLNEISGEATLIESERKTFLEHRQKINGWIEEVKVGTKNPNGPRTG